jgi:hypothetical protein
MFLDDGDHFLGQREDVLHRREDLFGHEDHVLNCESKLRP